MRKKFLVLGMTAGLVASMGLVGCSNNTATGESQGTSVETTVAVVENAVDGTSSAEEVVEVEESTEYETVAQVAVASGLVKEIAEDSVTVELEDGTVVVAMVGEGTEVSENLDIDFLVNITYDGVMTRSIPAQLPNVISIDVVEDINLGEPVEESVDVSEGESVAELSETSTTDDEAVLFVTTKGTITEVNEADIHFENEAGVEIVANITEATEVYEDMAVGDKVSIDHADMMLMSEPGILPEVLRINKVE